MIDYKNMEIFTKNKQFRKITEDYFQQETVSIGQLTRKLFSYMRKLVHDCRLSREYIAEFRLSVPHTVHFKYDVNQSSLIMNLFGGKKHLMCVEIGPRYPSTYLYPFFRKFWDLTPQNEPVPILGSYYRYLNDKGRFYIHKKYDAASGVDPFAIFTMRKERTHPLQYFHVLYRKLFMPKGTHLVLGQQHVLRDNFSRNKSIICVVNEVIKSRTGVGILIPKHQEPYWGDNYYGHE